MVVFNCVFVVLTKFVYLNFYYLDSEAFAAVILWVKSLDGWESLLSNIANFFGGDYLFTQLCLLFIPRFPQPCLSLSSNMSS